MAETMAEEAKDVFKVAAPRRRRCGFHTYCVMCFFAACVPCIIATTLWSSMGWGDECIAFLEGNQEFANYCAIGVSVFLLVLYLLDFFCPPHLPGQFLRFFSKDDFSGLVVMVLIGAGVVGTSLLYAKEYPALPVLVTVLCGPALLATVRAVSKPRFTMSTRRGQPDQREALQLLTFMAGEEHDTRDFYAGAMTALVISGGLTLIVWILWVMSVDLKLEDSNLDDQEKERIYIRWLAPLIAGLANLALGFIARLRVSLSRDYQGTDDLRVDLIVKACCEGEFADGTESREKVIARHLRSSGTFAAFERLSEANQKKFAREHLHNVMKLFNTMKVIGCGILTLLGAIYVAMQLVAADSHVAQLILGFVGVLFLSFVTFLFASFGRLMNNLKEWLFECPLGRLAIALSKNDWVRASAVVVLPAVPLVLVVSAVNQFVRRCRGLYLRIPPRSCGSFTKQAEDAPSGAKGSRASHCSAHEEEIKVSAAPQDQLITERIMVMLQAVLSWNWVSIIPKIYLLALLFLAWILSPRLLNVALSWLSDVLREGFHFALIVLLTLLAGISCFLLPPVPGLPVYLFTGVIIAATCPSGFWAGCVIAIFMGLILKLAACAMQQKLIGEALGSSTWVKSQVGVNRPFFRAVEAVLQRQGMSWGKVAILCGGPDWPTSVLCGILRCSLLEMELGTLPIIIFVAPCTLCGSFYLKSSESEVWDNATNLMIFLSLVVNTVFGVGAVWAVQEEIDTNTWEVSKPLLQHIHLDWLDYCSEQLSQSCVIKWCDIPCVVRFMAVLGVLCEVLAGHMLYWWSTSCFGSFAITDDIAELKWYGDDGLFKLEGVLGLGVMFGGFAGYVVFSCFRARKQAAPFAAKAERLKLAEPVWKEERRQQAVKAAQTYRPSITEVMKVSPKSTKFTIDKE